MSVRTFRVTVPQTVITYTVDEDGFWQEGEDREDWFLKYKLKSDVMATLDIGHYGDADYGIAFVGGDVPDGEDSIRVEEITNA